MITLIQNLFIIKNGVLIFSQNFGECHSLPNDDLISSFLSVVDIFAKEITGATIETITFDQIHLFFHKDVRDTKILYIMIVDMDNDFNDVKDTILKISDFFYNLYSDILINFKGITTPYLVFGDLLAKKNILKENCGKYLKCVDCPNSSGDSTILEYIDLHRDPPLKKITNRVQGIQTIIEEE